MRPGLLILTLLATGDRAALLAADRAYARDGLLAAFGDGPWRILAYVRNAVDSATSLEPPPRRWAPTPPHLGPADRAELLRVDRQFAAGSLARGARASFLTFAAENAVTLSGGGTVRYGREAIGESFDGAPAGAVADAGNARPAP
jgi:hypothetical protein